VIGEERGRDYLDPWDSTHMIDLSPEALNVTSDPIRILFQRRFGSDDGEDNPEQPLLGTVHTYLALRPPSLDDG
jgi:hypothetical protein